MPDPQERKEECRREVRAHRANRPGIAQTPATIKRGLSEWDFTEEEVKSACIFLESLGHLSKESAPLGATVYYKITATGTLAHERNQ